MTSLTTTSRRSPSATPSMIRWLQLTGRLLARDWHLFIRNRLSIIGLSLLGVFLLMAVAQPILMATIWPKNLYHPETGFDLYVVPWPAPPSADHWLGVDAMGRDILSMLLASTPPAF